MEEELGKQEEDTCIKISVPLHPLNNIEITNYFNYQARSNGVFLRNNLPTIKDGAYFINLDDKVKK